MWRSECYVTCHKVTQLISGRYRIGNQISIHFEYITRTSPRIWKLVCWNESRGRFICVYIDLTSLHEASTLVAGNVTKNAISGNLISGLYILIVWGVNIILELPQRDLLLPGRREVLTQTQAMETVTCTARSACKPARVRLWLHSWHLYLILITASQLGQRHKDTDKEAANKPSSSVVLPSVCQKCVSLSVTKLIYSGEKKPMSQRAKDNILILVRWFTILVQGSASYNFMHVCPEKWRMCWVCNKLAPIPSTHETNSIMLSWGSLSI